jgi:hypothetical protein
MHMVGRTPIHREVFRPAFSASLHLAPPELLGVLLIEDADEITLCVLAFEPHADVSGMAQLVGYLPDPPSAAGSYFLVSPGCSHWSS